MHWIKRLSLCGLVALLAATLSVSHAEDNSVTITAALSSFSAGIFKQTILQQFEMTHPNIKVKVITKDAFIAPPTAGLDAYLKAVQDYVSSADVVHVGNSFSMLEATRAGYFLDLSPLIATDKGLNSDDFYPAVWKSFQWDHRIWALPTGADIMVMGYKPSAFDAVGLAYPNAKWAVDDLANAMRKLAKKDTSGTVTLPSLFTLGNEARSALFQSLIGDSVFDSSTTPDTLKFAKPAVEKILDTWYHLDQEGLFANDLNAAPMSIMPIGFLGRQPGGTEERVGVALPGGQVGLQTEGFSVSAGTQHPAEAYALASFLTTHPEAVGGLSSSPARKNVTDTLSADNGPRPGPIAFSPELKALIDQGLNTGLSLTDLRYADYLNQAAAKMKSDNLDAHSALQSAEIQATQNQTAAVNAKAKTTIVVATPLPVNIAAGKITLNFGMVSNVLPLPNQDKWDKLAQDFASSDPQVGLVNIDQARTPDLSQLADKYDCFYLPYNAVPGAKLTNLLNLDPFLAADKNFAKDDVVGNVLSQLQQDNKTWGYPLMIVPDMLSYDSQLFSKANIPEPTNGWTVEAFYDALKALKANSQEPPFTALTPGGTHLLLLIAAYGGLPLDYRTDPPTIKFTDPATVQAIRQVLDLARNGYIKYTSLGNVGGIMVFTASKRSPITTRSLLPPGARINTTGSDTPDPYKPVPYPKGTQYNVLSYGIDTAYISAKAQNPEACYRWISMIGQHPELFNAMPARRSLINSQSTATVQGAQTVTVYNQIDALLKDPKTVSFPSLFQGGASQVGFLVQHWLYQAFDKYVLQNGDLEVALKDAETYAQAFMQCTATISAYDPSSTQTADDYNKQYLACAVKVDPRLKDFAKGLG